MAQISHAWRVLAQTEVHPDWILQGRPLHPCPTKPPNMLPVELVSSHEVVLFPETSYSHPRLHGILLCHC